MGDELSVTVRRERGVVIAEVTGDMDMSTAAGLRERLSGLAGSGQPLIVDLNRVTFIDSAGLGALVGAARRAEVLGGSLHAVCSRPQTLVHARSRTQMTGVCQMTTTEPASTIGLDTVAELAAQLRVDSVRSSTSAGSGHPTSSMSAADLLAVLITRHLCYDWDQPRRSTTT